MKEQTLIEMKNKVEALVRVLQQVIDEQQHLTALASGTMQALKLMPGYEDAIKALTDKAKEEIESRAVDRTSATENNSAPS
jgi:peptidyl-tRNA hydrolase